MSDHKVKRESMAKIVVVDDDAGRLQAFRDYFAARNDVTLRRTQFAVDMKAIINPAAEGRTLDAFLLDVRLPSLPKEQRNILPEFLPPRALALVQELDENQYTKGAPIVVYTQYAFTPDVQKQLDKIRSDYPAVQVYDWRPSPEEALRAALTAVCDVDVTVVRNADNPAEFEVVAGETLPPERLASAEFRLNGVQPELSEPTRTGGRLVGFPKESLFERDVNYLLVQLDGKKSFFAF